ncbi:MAG TPA: hypothetical protein VF245_12930 [Solirubrobacterales bacterium]
MNTPPVVGFAGTRPADAFGPDWQVIDRRDGRVIAEKYAPRSPDYPPDDPPMSAQGAAEALAAELNAMCLGIRHVPYGALCEEARRLRIEGATA